MLSTDNNVQEPGNTQNYNRYSYAFNNPLRYTDPDGEIAFNVGAAIVGGIIGLATNVFIAGVNGNIKDWGDLAYYATSGAAVGALAGFTFGGSLLAAAPTASAASAFWTGAGLGALNGAIGGAAQGALNATYRAIKYHEPWKNVGKDAAWGALTGGIIGGVVGGAVGAYRFYHPSKVPTNIDFGEPGSSQGDKSKVLIDKLVGESVDAPPFKNAIAQGIDHGFEDISQLQPTQYVTKSEKAFSKFYNQLKVDQTITEPIKYIEYNGVKHIVDGHHRFWSAQKLNIRIVPVEQVFFPFRGYQTPSDLILVGSHPGWWKYFKF